MTASLCFLYPSWDGQKLPEELNACLTFYISQDALNTPTVIIIYFIISVTKVHKPSTPIVSFYCVVMEVLKLAATSFV